MTRTSDMTDLDEHIARFSHHDTVDMQDPYPLFAKVRAPSATRSGGK